MDYSLLVGLHNPTDPSTVFPRIDSLGLSTHQSTRIQIDSPGAAAATSIPPPSATGSSVIISGCTGFCSFMNGIYEEISERLGEREVYRLSGGVPQGNGNLSGMDWS